MSQVAFRRDTEDPEIVRTVRRRSSASKSGCKMLCLMTLADVEAVSLETLTPWREELLWRLFVDTYNHLTLGYGDELIEPSQAGQHRAAGEPSGGPVGERHLAFPRRACRAGICSSSIGEAIYRHVRLARDIHPDEVHLCARAERVGLGADRRDARQAVPVLEHLGRAVVVRHGHPARPRDDEPERARARRLPVHRPGAVPRAQRRRAASRCSRCWRRWSSGRGQRDRPAAGPGAEPVPPPGRPG